MDWLSNLVEQAVSKADEALTDPPSRVVAAPGREVAWDCEMAWVRVVGMTPRFADGGGGSMGATARQMPRTLVGWDVQLGVGTIRCVSTMNDRGDPPSPNQLHKDTMLLTRDAFDLRLLSFEGVKGVLSWNVTRYDPLGPEGGYAGGEFVISVLVACP